MYCSRRAKYGSRSVLQSQFVNEHESGAQRHCRYSSRISWRRNRLKDCSTRLFCGRMQLCSRTRKRVVVDTGANVLNYRSQTNITRTTMLGNLSVSTELFYRNVVLCLTSDYAHRHIGVTCQSISRPDYTPAILYPYKN